MSEKFAMADLTGGEMNALVKTVGGSNVVRQILRGEITVRVIKGLLEEFGPMTETRAIANFVARNKFVADVQGELPIWSLSASFQRIFLDVIELDVPFAMLKQSKLLKPATNPVILAALGNTTKIEKARVALAHVFSYLKTADHRFRFLFYVADAKGIIWAVHASWNVGGWAINAYPNSNSGEWRENIYVMSYGFFVS